MSMNKDLGKGLDRGLDCGLDLETIFYAKALRDIRRMSRHKRKQLKILARKWSSLRSILPAVLSSEDAQLALEFSQDSQLVHYVFQDLPEHGIEQFRVGDIVTCGEDGDYAEVLRLVPATGKVHVAWLVLNDDDDECVDDRFCVHLPTGDHVRWKGYMLSNVRQPEDEAFHWEHVHKAKVEDLDLVPGKRYMMDMGIVDSYPGHDFESLEDELVESPAEIVGILRGNTGLARSIVALKAELKGGNFCNQHPRLPFVMENLPTFEAPDQAMERSPVQGTCVWCNTIKTLTLFHGPLGMGSVCFEKYTMFQGLEQFVRGLRERFPGPFDQDDADNIQKLVDQAQQLVTHDDDQGPHRRRIRRSC